MNSANLLLTYKKKKFDKMPQFQWITQCKRNCSLKVAFLPPAHVVRREVMFSVCSHPEGGCTPSPSHNTSTGPMSFLGGIPHLHPIKLPLVPCPFLGVPQCLVLGAFRGWGGGGGTPVPDGQLRIGYPPARSGWGTPPPPPARS